MSLTAASTLLSDLEHAAMGYAQDPTEHTARRLDAARAKALAALPAPVPAVAITAEMVHRLRDASDHPMMECKRALQINGGDMDRAKEWLRQPMHLREAPGVPAVHLSRPAPPGSPVPLGDFEAWLKENRDAKVSAVIGDVLVNYRAALAPKVRQDALWTDASDGLPKHGEEVLCKLEDGDKGEPGAHVLEVWDEVHPLANVERWVRVADLDAMQMQQSDAQGLHAAICQAVAIGNRSPDLAASAEGRQLLEILRGALDDYANASVHTSQDMPAPRPRHSA